MNFESSFDQQARRYDTYRPCYPDALVDAVLSYAGVSDGGRLLEIGCGTGQATRSFAERNNEILCVEPGENLIKFAKEKCRRFPRVSFAHSTFEEWQGEGRFQAIYAAQSFHWIEETLRYKKTHELLEDQGTLALFWNSIKDDTEFSRAENEVWVKHFGEKMRGSYSELFELEGLLELDSFRQSSYFKDVEYLQFPHEVEYTREQYLGLQGTYSDNAKMEAARREALFEDIGELIDGMGGTITVPYTAILFLGRKA